VTLAFAAGWQHGRQATGNSGYRFEQNRRRLLAHS